jgi:hypothetical protein
MSERNKKLRSPFGKSDNNTVVLGSTAVAVHFDHAGQSVTVEGTGTQNITFTSENLQNGEIVTLAVKGVGGAAQLNVGSSSYRAGNGVTVLYPHVYSTNGVATELMTLKARTAND